MFKRFGLLLIVLLIGVPVYASFLPSQIIISTTQEEKLEKEAQKYLEKSEKLFEEYHKSTNKEEISKKQSRLMKFIKGLKKLSLPLQKALIKTALWEAKKICEKIDDVESAVFLTMPQFAVVDALKDVAVPELVKNFMDKNNDAEFRYLCMESFYGPKDSIVVEPLITVMMDSTDRLRGQACKILGVIRDKRAVEPMIELYWKGQMRKDVVWSLGAIGDKRAFDVLMDGLKNGDNKLKFHCIRSFEYLKDKRAVPVLIKMLQSKKEIDVPSLGVKSIKPYIALALGNIGDERAVPVLKKMLKHKDSYYRHTAAVALGKIRDKRALDALISLAEKGELDAIKAIGKIGGDRAIEALERLKPKFKDIPGPYFQKCFNEALKEAKNRK